jgi:hypothetical protein
MEQATTIRRRCLSKLSSSLSSQRSLFPLRYGCSRLMMCFARVLIPFIFSPVSSFIDGRGVIDREHRGRVRLSTTSFDKLPGKVIQGTSQVVGRVPDDHGQVGRQVRATNEVVALSCLRIVIAPELIRLGFAEGLDQPFEVTDVLVGPFNFPRNTRQSFCP